jgi:serine phosphatase RsbU (regulator of sigma subunit)
LPADRVAPQQAVVFPEADAWVLLPLELTDALQLNGVAITDKVQLRNNDLITLYDYSIRAFLDDSRSALRSTAHASVAQLARFVAAQLPQGSVVKKNDEPLTILPAQVARIGKVNVLLGGCNLVPELMNIALRALLEQFAAQRAWMGIRRVNYGPMDYQEGRSIAGQTVDLPPIGEHLKPRALDRGQFVLVPLVSPDEPLSVLIGPLLGPDGPLGMIHLDSGDSGRRFDTNDLDYFIFLLNALGIQLDAILKQQAKNRAATLDGEVVVAHAIQGRLTPRKLPQWEDQLTFGAFREPGRERTSDVYDVVKMANQAAAIMIANTSATGPLPGMLMAQAQAAFRTAIMHQDAPHVFMKMVNVLLYDGQPDHPLDCLMGMIDPDAGTMRYSIAGKMGAYIIGGRGEERSLAPASPSPSLGTVKNASYEVHTEELGAAETLVLFTPGVITARNSRDEVFGEERFINILCDGFGQLASTMLKEMLSDLRHFTEGGVQPDDITVILAHKV